MKISQKQIIWGVSIAAGLTGLGLLIAHHSKKKSGDDSADTTITLPSENAAKAITAAAVAGAQSVKGWLKPVTAKISSPFGYRSDPVKKVHQFHNGIDLPVPLNTKVKSPAAGTIANVYSNKDGGNQVIVLHDNGYTSGYAHLTKATVKKGDKVKQGDVIALSGNTGKSTGPHVHWTLKDKKGNYLDPGVVYKAAA